VASLDADSDPDVTPQDLVTHPITVLTSFVMGLWQLLAIGPIDAVAVTIWGNAGQLFTFTSIASSTIIPTLELPPWASTGFQAASLVFGLILAAKIGETVLKRLGDRLEES